MIPRPRTTNTTGWRGNNDTAPDDPAASKTRSPSTRYMSTLPLYVAVPLALVGLLTLSVLVLHQFQVRQNKIRHYSHVTRSTVTLDDDNDDDDDNDNNDNNDKNDESLDVESTSRRETPCHYC